MDFYFPSSIDEACSLLSDAGGDARLIAGGVALMVLVRHELFFPTRLVSVKRIPGLDEIRFDDQEGLHIGALVTHHQIETSPTVREKYPALAQCAHHVGNLRVRNMGTLVGDLCQADNHSDPAPLLGVLGAKIKVRSVRGERIIPAEDFHLGIYETALKDDEMVTEVSLPPPPQSATIAYLRFSGNSPVDWPILGAAGVMVQEDALCKEVKIAVGSLTATPLQFDAETELLKGKKLTASLIQRFARACVSRIDPVADERCSEWYKKQIAEVYIRRTLETLRRKPK